MKNESIAKTFGVATLLCVVCAIIVSLSDVALKERQNANKALDKNVNLLRVAGEVGDKEKISPEDAAKKLEAAKVVVVDLETGAIVPDADPKAVEADKTNLRALDPDVNVAKIDKKDSPKLAVVYLFNDEQGALKTVVLPIVGKGLWSTLRGFLALNGDLKTVARIVFYEQGETAGLGGEITNPSWTKNWEGKVAFDDAYVPIVKVAKGAASADFEVDGISGATLTGNGVTNTVQFWLGENGFGPFLKTLRQDAPNATPASEE
ncbi:MAG: Na(+)-translocating NADH-quinone reductase subunit C [Thermoguttaceae bacterium]|nr:Na(+)-translocating NADH-quinone reductase subunit C [Thermoguttaceae bacterium]